MNILAKPAFKNKKSQPYNHLLYSAMCDVGSVKIYEFSLKQVFRLKYDIFHIHWPENYTGLRSFFRAAIKSTILLFIMYLLKYRGTKIVWTFHNYRAHDGCHPFIEKVFYFFLQRIVDGVVYISEISRTLSYKKFPVLKKKRYVITMIGTYSGYYPNNITRKQARLKLQIDSSKNVILSLGHVRPYKGIEGLIDIFLQLKDNDSILIIAGQSFPLGYINSLKKRARKSSIIQFHDNFIDDNELQTYYQCADLVIVNYEDILNSGSVILSLSFGSTILVPENDSIIELKNKISSDLIIPYQKPLTYDLIDTILKNPITKNYKVHESMNWNNIARETLVLYKDLIANKRPF